jgi:DNA-binding LytR/AlgR family response regulator
MKNIQKRKYKNTCDTLIPIGSWKLVEPKEVVMMIANVNYTTIHFEDGETVFVATSLGELESRFLSFNFFRLHKSYMINLNFVKDFKADIMEVSLKNDFQFIVSRRKRRAFQEELALRI